MGRRLRMARMLFSARRYLWLLPVLSLLVLSCELSKNEQVEHTLSFDRLLDSLKLFDEVVITLKNLDGDILDEIYRGKVVEAADVERLPGPHWDGGPVKVSIIGTVGGKVVYQVETRFNPATGTRDNIQVFVSPEIVLNSTVKILTLLPGDSMELPTITVLPLNLLDKSLEWQVAPDSLVVLGSGFLKALQVGEGEFTVKLKTNPDAKLIIPFTITVSGLVPESLSIQPESLTVTAQGLPRQLTASITPSAASSAVDWSSSDTGVASVDSTGLVQGKRRGEITILASSQVRPNVRATAHVNVSGPIPVEKVAFATDTLDLHSGGLAESLWVSVEPPGASASVTFTLTDSTIAAVQSGRISGSAAGTLKVIAASAFNPSVRDTLFVRITVPLPTDTLPPAVKKVAFSKDTLKLQAGDPAESLLISVDPPGADTSVTFSLSDQTKATLTSGKLTATAAGMVSVIAVSVSNSLAKDTLFVKITARPPVDTTTTPKDTVPPGQPTVRVKPTGPTMERRPVWTWTTGAGGSGSFEVSLDLSTFGPTAIALSDTSYKPSGNLAMGVHILYVRERDAAGNWSKSGSSAVEIDTAGPLAPKIFGTTPTSALPRWTWTTGGGGGAGLFRSRLGDANFPANASESIDTVYALTSAVGGSIYTLYVQERDVAGNWSPAANFPIKYDLTKPTVTISLPQASGTFITALDTVTLSGTTSGPNPIAQVQYALDGGVAKTISVGAGGSWSIPMSAVANAKTTVVKVTSTDNLGNTGEASLSILRDSDPPLPPVSLSTPTSPSNVATASWTWAAGSDGAAGSGLSGKYRWKLNTGTWNEILTAAATGVILIEGTNTFLVQEQDRAGNWSTSVTGIVVLDTKVPDTVTFTGTDSSTTTSLSPTWTWTRSTTNGGSGQYVLKLDAGAEFDWTTTSYTPVTPLSDNATHTLTVKEKDQVAGVLGMGKSFSYKVKQTTDAWGGLKNAPIKSAGCGKALGTINQSGTYHISSAGARGDYIIDIPTGYDKDTPYRIIFGMHCMGGTAAKVAADDKGDDLSAYYSLKTQAAIDNIQCIFVAPQGNSDGTWNPTDDPKFFLDILASVEDNLCVDTTRVFVAGFSFGAMYSYALSLAYPEKIRAVATYAPANYNFIPQPTNRHIPIAYYQTTGTTDATCKWINNDAQKTGGKYCLLQHAEDNGCTSTATDIKLATTGTHVTTEFAGCKEGYPVKFSSFQAGHQAVHSDTGSSINWIEPETWEFFKQF